MKKSSHPIRISVVSYLNSRPFIFGLKNSTLLEGIEIKEDIPSVCADKLKNGEADIGLIPIAVLPGLENYEIISDYCIGADGEVGSVLLFSHVPLDKVSHILLDYQSRTSVLLTKVLAENHWKIFPQWIETSPGFENKIAGSTAGIVIGDRAMIMKDEFPYVYDLASEWKNHTSLPFVFACWISVRPMEKKFLLKFNEALSDGLKNIEVVSKLSVTPELTSEKVSHYLNHLVDYKFDEKKNSAMKLFFELVNNLKPAEKSGVGKF